MSTSLDPASLVPMDIFSGDFSLRTQLTYAQPDNLLLGEAIYRRNARLWLHEDLARIVLLACRICRKNHGFHMVLYDGLRTVEAQQKMLECARVKQNPHWLEEPRLLSPPGAGGHPRGMAIDVALETPQGQLLDMGTPFDFLAENAAPEHNPAHRRHPHLSSQASENRAILENVMMRAAKILNLPLLPLPQEWWDFRLPSSIYERYEPLSDADLPWQMRMTDKILENNPPDFLPAHFEKLRTRLMSQIGGL